MAYEGCSKIIRFEALEDPTEKFTLEKIIATGTYGEVHEGKDNSCEYQTKYP